MSDYFPQKDKFCALDFCLLLKSLCWWSALNDLAKRIGTNLCTMCVLRSADCLLNLLGEQKRAQSVDDSDKLRAI